MVKRITEERDLLSTLLAEKEFTCESLQEENEELNAKLYLAQKEAMNLLILSGNRLWLITVIIAPLDTSTWCSPNDRGIN